MAYISPFSAAARESAGLPEQADHSFFQRFINTLSSPLYATANLAKGEFGEAASVFAKGISGGELFGFAPITSGEADTMSDVLKKYGMKKGTARSVLGFGLDVAADPLTYLTGGVASGARTALSGVGRGATRHALTESGEQAMKIFIKKTSEKAIQKAAEKGAITAGGKRILEMGAEKAAEKGFLLDLGRRTVGKEVTEGITKEATEKMFYEAGEEAAKKLKYFDTGGIQVSLPFSKFKKTVASHDRIKGIIQSIPGVSPAAAEFTAKRFAENIAFPIGGTALSAIKAGLGSFKFTRDILTKLNPRSKQFMTEGENVILDDANLKHGQKLVNREATTQLFNQIPESLHREAVVAFESEGIDGLRRALGQSNKSMDEFKELADIDFFKSFDKVKPTDIAEAFKNGQETLYRWNLENSLDFKKYFDGLKEFGATQSVVNAVSRKIQLGDIKGLKKLAEETGVTGIVGQVELIAKELRDIGRVENHVYRQAKNYPDYVAALNEKGLPVPRRTAVLSAVHAIREGGAKINKSDFLAKQGLNKSEIETAKRILSGKDRLLESQLTRNPISSEWRERAFKNFAEGEAEGLIYDTNIVNMFAHQIQNAADVSRTTHLDRELSKHYAKSPQVIQRLGIEKGLNKKASSEQKVIEMLLKRKEKLHNKINEAKSKLHKAKKETSVERLKKRIEKLKGFDKKMDVDLSRKYARSGLLADVNLETLDLSPGMKQILNDVKNVDIPSQAMESYREFTDKSLKPAMTVINPKFHIRNAFGGISMGGFNPRIGAIAMVRGIIGLPQLLLNGFGGKKVASAVTTYQRAVGADKLLMEVGSKTKLPKQAQDILDTVITSKTGTKATLEDLIKEAKVYGGVIGAGAEQEIAKLARGRGGALRKGYNAVVDFGAGVSQRMEDSMRFSHFVESFKSGVSPQQASEMTKKFFVDYTPSSAFERNMRTWIPFYKFSKQILTEYLPEIAKRPRMMTPYTGLYRQHEKSEDVPEWMRETMTFKVSEDSDGNPLYLTGFGLPIETLSSIGSLDRAMSMLNPIPKTAIEMATGKNLFFGSEFGSYDAPYQSIMRLPDKQKELFLDKHINKDGEVYWTMDPMKRELIDRLPGYSWFAGVNKIADSRTSLLVNLANGFTGLNFKNLDARQRERAMAEITEKAMKKAVRDGKLGKFSKYYQKDYDPESDAKQYIQVQKYQDAKRKERKKYGLR